MPENRNRTTLFLVFLWAVLVVTALLCRPLMPIDETRYVSVAWEMWHNSNFLVPQLNGMPYSHKPPLLFYLMHLGWFVFGVNEWSARMVGPFFSLLNLFITAHLARRLWPAERHISRIAPFVLLATPLWAVMTTLVMFDQLLTFFILLGAEGLLAGAGGKNRVSGLLLFATAIGGGILSKGPVVLLVLLPLGMLAPWWQETETRATWRWYSGLAFSLTVGLAIALAWAIPAAEAGGPAYGRAILWGQTAGRVVKSFAHRRPFWWYMPVIPIVVLPWTGQLLRQIKSLRMPMDHGTRFCLGWIIPALLFFSLVSGKQIHYLLPLLPAAALLLTKIMLSVERSPSSIPLKTMAVVYLVAGTILAVLPYITYQAEGLDRVQQTALFWALPFIIGGIILLRTRPRHVDTTIIRSCVAMVVLFALVHLGPFRQLAPTYDLGPMAAKIAEQQKEGKLVAICPAKYSNQFQFYGRLAEPLNAISNYRKLKRWLHNHPDAVAVMIPKKPLPEIPGIQPEFSHSFGGRRQSSLWRAGPLSNVLEKQ